MQSSNIENQEQVEYRAIAKAKFEETGKDVFVVAKDGSYLYLGFDDDFSWEDVIFVHKKF